MLFNWKWLRGDLDDPQEASTFAALSIRLDSHLLTRLYDNIAGGDRDSINVPLYPLALNLAENWWSFLHEPKKSETHEEGRHALDAGMNGFIFPAINIWSGGNDTLFFEVPNIPQKFSNIEFLRSNELRNIHVSRNEIEENLFVFIKSVIDRCDRLAVSDPLREAWNRVIESMKDDEEREYCVASGRLGINPYDPDSLDISVFSSKLSPHLFSDVCDATTEPELSAAVAWAAEGEHYLGELPAIRVENFGPQPARDPRQRIWEHGYETARLVRQNLGLEGLRPRTVIDNIFGPAVRGDGSVFTKPPHFGLEAISDRMNGAMRVALPKSPARLRRSLLCRAAYLAWGAMDGDASAVTTASTLEQQASRAFAAELLAPSELLRNEAGSTGLTLSDIERIAGENICPQSTVIWQAYNHGIPLRGVGLPTT